MDIGDAECMVLFYLFGRSLFLWLFMVYDRLCGCVPCLRYPPKGETTSGILLLLLFIKRLAIRNSDNFVAFWVELVPISLIVEAIPGF